MIVSLSAFIVPAVMVAFASAFLLTSRWAGKLALFWAAGLFAAACGFAVPTLPLPPPVLALTANALFLFTAFAYGHALLLQLGRPTQWRGRAVVAALCYLVIASAIFRGDLQTELMLADLAWVLLLAWPLLRALPHARTAAHRALVAVIGVIALESLVRVVAIGWLVTAGSGPEAFFTSPYAAFAQATAGILVAVFGLVALGNIVQTIVDGFRRDAERDPLTGLLNRRGLDRAGAGYDPQKGAVSVIQCDLDHFKRINDTYGHAAGDQVLQRVAALILDIVPADAAVARFGGEEFVVLLGNMRLADAGMLAHRMRMALGNLAWHEIGMAEQLTASFGVAQWSPSDYALADALGRADAALYLAKAEGRNQVYLESRRPFAVPAPRVVRSA